jgi:hypothetical protein
LDPLFVEKSYYIAPDSIDKRRKKGKESSSTTTIQDKAYSLLVVVLPEIGDNLAYKDGLHFCEEVYPNRNRPKV